MFELGASSDRINPYTDPGSYLWWEAWIGSIPTAQAKALIRPTLEKIRRKHPRFRLALRVARRKGQTFIGIQRLPNSPASDLPDGWDFFDLPGLT
jgi:hypothetical protein